MKHRLGIAFLALLLASCSGGGSETPVSPFTLPDLEGKSMREARLEVGADLLFEEVRVESSKYTEDRILGYSKLSPGDVVEKGTRVKVNVALRPSGSKTIEDGLVKYMNQIAMTTGPDSLNADTLLAAGARGTDLGIPFSLPDGRNMLLYGDTFSNDNMGGLWNSNFMAITSDSDLSDGLLFDSVVTNSRGAIQPFAQGAHQSGSEEDIGTEVTKIPTGGISIGDDVYIFYMSIRYWGVSGSWLVTYNQAVKATDSTYQTWENVPELKWTDDEFYQGGQIYPFHNPKDEERIYFLCIPGGRNDGAVMMRVDKDSFEDRDSYEYLTAEDTWTVGDTGMAALNSNPYYVIDPPFSEPSIMYSEYLNKYVACALKGTAICLLVSDEVGGPYTSHAVVKAEDFPGLYGGFVHSAFSDCGGERIYLQLSQWTPIYNTSLVEVVFE